MYTGRQVEKGLSTCFLVYLFSFFQVELFYIAWDIKLHLHALYKGHDE